MLLSTIEVIAFFTSTVALIPQIIKTTRMRSAADLSWLMLINFNICSLAWILYGWQIKANAVLMTNLVMMATSLYLLALKVHYGQQEKS